MCFRRSPVAGAATLLAFLTTLALPLASATHHASGTVDAGWGEAPVAIGHPVTQVEIVRPLLAGDHCALCHWARTLGHTVADRQAWHQPDLMPVSPPVIAIGAPAPGIPDSRTPRGPPSIV